MTISMFQCLLIGLWTAFCLAGMLFGIYTNRCLVMAAGVGLILGDLPTGLAMGAVGELAFMGFGVSQGGSVPPNPMGPGIVGTIIAITMKKGKALAEAYAAAPSPDVSVVTPLGYQTPAEFYAPAYATEKARRSMVPDYRTTLYWNPTVKLDDTGQAIVEFYTSDAPADYDISIEGVTQTGKIVQRRQRLLPE